MPGGFFITGTDTGVGKTWVSVALLEKVNSQGLQTAAMKPVASGCAQTAEGLRNADALCLQQVASVKLAYEEVNPYAFAPSIAPHLAARQAGVLIDPALIQQHYARLAAKADVTIVEGVGGWHVPLNDRQSMRDVAKLLNLPVLLVVGLRLGCLNHALLTAEAIQRDGLQLAGWLANTIDADMPCREENIRSLENLISAPLIAEIPHLDAWQRGCLAGLISLP